MAGILDGKALSAEIRDRIREKVGAHLKKGHAAPGLTVVLVGDDPASRVYVNAKKKACEAAGINSREIKLDAGITQEKLLSVIEQLNGDPTVNGILVQLPLPSHLDSTLAINAVKPKKDVDGFHPLNVGRLSSGEDCFVPCTPYGVMKLLEHYRIPLEGKRATVIGRSNIVGKPMVQLLMRANATVTCAHSRTKNLPELVKSSEIVVAAIGKAEFVKGDWLSEKSVVIDVGTNSVEDPSTPKGYRLAGDVEQSVAIAKASWITPVPGGVGPMTIAMLLANTLKSAGIEDKI